MIKHIVWRPVTKSQIQKLTKILGYMCFMKKKADGALQGMLTVHGCSQNDGEHYESSSIHAPITNDAMIHIMLMLMSAN